MITLPRHFFKAKSKSPYKPSLLSHNDIKKRVNINQIKEEIQYILKRNSSPVSLYVQKYSNQRNIHNNLLQKKKSKILKRANQEMIQKTKNNRKIYEDYLLGDLTTRGYQKTVDFSIKNIQTLNTKQVFYVKQFSKDFSSSKTNLNSNKTIENDKKQQKNPNLYSDKQSQHLKLGKLLFYKDSSLKLRRTNLLNGQNLSQRRSPFKDTAIQTFYRQSSIDITKYLKPVSKSLMQADQCEQAQKPLAKDRSLQIFRKQMIPKHSVREQLLTPISDELRIPGTTKEYESQQLQPQQSTNYYLNSNFEQKNEQLNQTLNVMDQQLLAYYGKLKNPNLKNHYQKPYPKKTLIRSNSRNATLQNSLASKIFDARIKNSVEIKNSALENINSWKIQNLDPWQKLRIEDQIDHEQPFRGLKLEPHFSSYESHLISQSQSS